MGPLKGGAEEDDGRGHMYPSLTGRGDDLRLQRGPVGPEDPVARGLFVVRRLGLEAEYGLFCSKTGFRTYVLAVFGPFKGRKYGFPSHRGLFLLPTALQKGPGQRGAEYSRLRGAM